MHTLREKPYFKPIISTILFLLGFIVPSVLVFFFIGMPLQRLYAFPAAIPVLVWMVLFVFFFLRTIAEGREGYRGVLEALTVASENSGLGQDAVATMTAGLEQQKFDKIFTLMKRAITTKDYSKRLENLLEAVVALTKTSQVVLFALDARQQQLRAISAHGLQSAQYEKFTLQLKDSCVEQVLNNTGLMRVENKGKHCVTILQNTQLQALALRAAGQPVGILVFSPETNPAPVLSRHLYLDILEALAAVAANVIQLEQVNSTPAIQADESVKQQKLQAFTQQSAEVFQTVSRRFQVALAIVRNNLSLLLEDEQLPLAERQKFLQNAYEGSNRLARSLRRIEDLLQITGSQHLKQEREFSIFTLLHRLVTTYQALAQAKGLYLRMNYRGPVVTLRTDPEMVYEILSYLVENSIHYSDHGEIELTFAQDGDNLAFVIKDQGIGLTTEQCKRALQSFYRTEQAWELHPQGLGLGLTAAMRLAQELDGEVQITSPGLDQGAIAQLSLPLSVRVTQEAELAQQTASKPT